MGCMVQSNSIGSTFQTAFGVPSWIVGVVLVIICGFIFVGGVQRLAAVTEKIVPIMPLSSCWARWPYWSSAFSMSLPPSP